MTDWKSLLDPCIMIVDMTAASVLSLLLPIGLRWDHLHGLSGDKLREEGGGKSFFFFFFFLKHFMLNFFFFFNYFISLFFFFFFFLKHFMLNAGRIFVRFS